MRSNVRQRTLHGCRKLCRALYALTCPLLLASTCVNEHPECDYWAKLGECEGNPGYMLVFCKLACDSCIRYVAEECRDKRPDCTALTALGECLLNASSMLELCPTTCSFCGPGDPCRLHPEDRAAFPKPGDIDAFFARLPLDPAVQQYEPRLLGDHPWPVVFDSFLSAEEVNEVLALFESGWVRSRAGGVPGKDSLSDGVRTSDQIWCDRDWCSSSPAMRRIVERVEAITGIPASHYEATQVLRYLPGQRYKEHTDWVMEHKRLAHGPRVLTFFVYLSDVPEAGTHFLNLNVTMPAARGKAVLWPSVSSQNVFWEEDLSLHEGLPPEVGTKYAANVWIHQHWFEHYQRQQCSMHDRPLRYLIPSGTEL